MRKSLITLGLVAAGLVLGGPALASQELAKANGCVTCHDATKKKMGPSNKDIAAKYKGDADKALAAVKASKAHADVKASDADLKAIVGWMVK